MRKRFRREVELREGRASRGRTFCREHGLAAASAVTLRSVGCSLSHPGGDPRIAKSIEYDRFDPLNNPVNRIMGLHGALVVLPNTGNTPYTSPTDAIQRLFNDLPTLASWSFWYRRQSRAGLKRTLPTRAAAEPAFRPAALHAGEL